MHVNDWKRIAEQEARRYRDNRAFIQGVLDSGGDGSDRYRMKQKWVLAVDYVLAYLHRTDADTCCMDIVLYPYESRFSPSDRKHS